MKNRIAGIVAALVIALPAAASDPTGPAPEFVLPAKAGGQLDLAKYKGQVVMINFWASWCGPCRQEMPLLEDIYKKYNKLGFTLIGVNVEPDSKAADDWLKVTPVSFPVVYDKEDFHKARGANKAVNYLYADGHIKNLLTIEGTK